MPTTVNIHEAKTQLSQLLQQVARGEEVIIARAGTPVARLVPFVERPARRVPGTAAGQITMADDFNAPLPEDELRAWEGGAV